MSNHLRQNQRFAYQAARDAGLNDQIAKVLVANFTGESLHDPYYRAWDRKHYSQGIAQWSQDRAERIRAHFGKYPIKMTVAEQVAAFLWEAKRFYPKTWRAINDTNLTPEQQMEIIVRDFERPQYPARDIQRRMKFYASLQGLTDHGTV